MEPKYKYLKKKKKSVVLVFKTHLPTKFAFPEGQSKYNVQINEGKKVNLNSISSLLLNFERFNNAS